MINILKDVINPYNWIKLILSPSKLKVFFERCIYYPGLKFGYTKSNLYKNFVIKVTIFFAKKNKYFKEIFFSDYPSKISTKINFDFKNHRFDEEKFQILRDNGIIVLENVLNEKDCNAIKLDFNNSLVSKDYDEIVGMKSKMIVIRKINKRLGNDSALNKLSDVVTKSIFGKIVSPNHHYMYSKSIKLPEDEYPGDNIFHVDRFLPN